MSSQPKQFGVAGQVFSLAQAQGRIARLGLTPRQQILNERWMHYTCTTYDARGTDWSGRPVLSRAEADGIVAGVQTLPSGFSDPLGSTLPLKFRRPTAPYYLGRVIVNRFTSLLFSEHHHPQIRVDGDPDTEDYLAALADAARLWQTMIRARTYGGAMGSVALSFHFANGKPVVEVFNPCWCTVDFVDVRTFEVRALEYRYQYPQTVRDPVTGKVGEIPYWYRRVIDDQADTIYQRCPVGEGDEPDWEEVGYESQVVHGFGFCPVVWVQNLPVDDDPDGDGEPDCAGVYDMIHEIDAQIASAGRAIQGNCDPTVVIKTEQGDRPAVVQKGNGSAIYVGPNGDARYMESEQAAAKAAMDHATQLRAWALEVAQCVLEEPGKAEARTATEIQLRYSSMTARADEYREQYGERGIKPLLLQMIKAIRFLAAGTPGINPATGQPAVLVATVTLPPKIVKAPDGTIQKSPRKLGPDDDTTIKLQWPPYFRPSLLEIELATRAAMLAKTGGLVDDEHASRFVAAGYDVEDVPAMLDVIKKEQKEHEADAQAMLASRQMGMGRGPGGGGGEGMRG